MAKKVLCDLCSEKVPAAELAYNEAEHTLNVCSSCSEVVTSNVKELFVAKAVKGGATAKAAKAEFAELSERSLGKRVLKRCIQLKEDVEDVPEVPAKKEKKVKEAPKSEDVEIDVDGDEIEEEVKKRTRKSKKDVEVEAPATPAKKEKKSKVEAQAEEIMITVDLSRLEKYLRTAVKDSKVALDGMKHKKGTDVAAVLETLINAQFNELITASLLKRYRNEARRCGFAKIYSTTVKDAKTSLA